MKTVLTLIAGASIALLASCSTPVESAPSCCGKCKKASAAASCCGVCQGETHTK